MNDNRPKFNEPSVLDYVKSKLSFGRGPKIEIPEPQVAENEVESFAQEVVETEAVQPLTTSHLSSTPFPWLSLVSLGLALLGQRMFEPPNSSAMVGIALYLMALAFLLWAILRGEWMLLSLPESSAGNDPLTFHLAAFLISIPFAILAFLFFSGNLFTIFNLTLWLIALVVFVWSLWLRDPNKPSLWQRIIEIVSRHEWQIRFTRWTLLILALSGIVIFFRVYHIQQTPAEPFSDHAEKLLDVYDVTQGLTHIFFPRNAGREAIQFYWTVLMNWIFGTGLSFLTLKIDTIGFGLFALPYMYLLGKEIGGRRVGLLAFFVTGIGYWPNMISRIGLRFPLYPLFVAPMMLYLIRGLRNCNRNDFILSGIFLGLGLNGYTPYRIVPFLVAAAIILYVIHAQSKGARRDVLIWFVIVGLTSLMVFIPLLRYVTENPEMFSYRALNAYRNSRTTLARAVVSNLCIQCLEWIEDVQLGRRQHLGRFCAASSRAGRCFGRVVPDWNCAHPCAISSKAPLARPVFASLRSHSSTPLNSFPGVP